MPRHGFQGRHTFQRRWLRERQRSAEIAAIPIDGQIVREYNGVTYVVTCRDGYWEYQGDMYPTLYAVAMVITGPKEYARSDGQAKRTMSNWSAVRFFQLRKPAVATTETP